MPYDRHGSALLQAAVLERAVIDLTIGGWDADQWDTESAYAWLTDRHRQDIMSAAGVCAFLCLNPNLLSEMVQEWCATHPPRRLRSIRVKRVSTYLRRKTQVPEPTGHLTAEAFDCEIPASPFGDIGVAPKHGHRRVVRLFKAHGRSEGLEHGGAANGQAGPHAGELRSAQDDRVIRAAPPTGSGDSIPDAATYAEHSVWRLIFGLANGDRTEQAQFVGFPERQQAAG
jgi:hypothetical protein